MLAKRMFVLLALTVLCAVPLIGCQQKGDGVDKPLTTTTDPPPPRPDKPEVSPSGGGGANPK